jgi:hypothetical protein
MAKKRSPKKKPRPKLPAAQPRSGGERRFAFKQLVESVQLVHAEAVAQVSRAVNLGLALRNWLIGCYVAEYELRGTDRAVYGEKLLDSLARELSGLNVSNCSRRQLYRYLRFYRAYPGIVGALSPQFRSLLPAKKTTAS